MTAKDYLEFKANVTRILSTSRRQAGLSQAHVAKLLRISQAAYSQYESGLREISAPVLAVFFSRLQVNPRCLMTGVIDDLRPATSLSLHPQGSFRMPRPYLRSPGFNVRSIAPILSSCVDRNTKTNESSLFSELRLDPLYFNVMDNQLNFELFRDLKLKVMEHLNVSNGDLLRHHFRGYSAHGLMHEAYLKAKNGIEAVSKYIECGNRYDDCFIREIDYKTKTQWVVSFSPKPSVSKYAFSKASENRNAIGEYFQHFLTEVAQYRQEWPSINVKTIASTHDGAQKCEYLLQTIVS